MQNVKMNVSGGIQIGGEKNRITHLSLCMCFYYIILFCFFEKELCITENFTFIINYKMYQYIYSTF